MSGPRLGTGAAPGKVVLFGEHAVVYGRPAVAAVLGCGLGATVEAGEAGAVLTIPRWGKSGLVVRLADDRGIEAIARAFRIALEGVGLDAESPVRVTLAGRLPLGVGLGSSAAFAVAVLRGLADYNGVELSLEALMAGAQAVEEVFHGNPSGMDHTVVTHGGCLRFQRDQTPAFVPIRCASPVPVVIASTPRQGTTREAVDRLRARWQAQPEPHERLFDAMAEITEAGIEALAQGDLGALGALFDLNHGCLSACGVSSLENETMVHIARKAGALGAKLTGAGHGGAIVAVTPERGDEVATALLEAGFAAFRTVVGGEAR